MSDVEGLNELLLAHNCVDLIHLDSEEGIVKYDLFITLAESETQGAKKISVVFFDVCELRVVDFGGGLTQFMDLKVTRIDDGLDRIRYELSDEEYEKIYCKFYSFSLLRNDKGEGV